MSPIVPLLLIVVVVAAPLRGATAPSDGQRRRFIAGAPDRLASADDRRLARRWYRADSAVGAYADVDRLGDPTWLAHEVEGYAYRFACGAAADCRRAVERLGSASVLQLAAGGRAEMLWTSGGHAVRLGWRRVVNTATGTMTVDRPPPDFLADLVVEWPSDLAVDSLDAGRRRIWAEAETDRQLYYLEAALRVEPMPDAARHFARAALQILGAQALGVDLAADGSEDLDRIRAWVDEQRDARRPVCEATPWCAPSSIIDAPVLSQR